MDEPAVEQDVFRVVFLARSVDEVVRRYLTRLKRLRDEGFEVHVLAGAGDLGGIGELDAAGVKFKAIPVRSAANMAGLAGAYFIIQAYLLEKRPVMVHSFGHRLAWQGTFAANQARVPAIFTTLDYHWLDEEPIHLPLGPLATFGVPPAVEHAEDGINRVVGTPYRIAMRRAYRWLAANVDRYVVTTKFDFQLVQDMDVVPPSKLEIAIGGAGVDLERYAMPDGGKPKREEARRALELPRTWRQVVGYVGPLTRRHGTENLVDAIQALRQTHPATGWLVVRRGKIADGQGRRLRRLERDGVVKLIEEERVDAEHYRAMDILAWSGRPSTPHDAILEAAALAVPTVSFDTPGGRSFIDDGKTGRLIFEESGQALAVGLARLLNDPKYMRDLGRRARSRAQSQMSRRAVDDDMLRLYDRVLEEGLRGEG